MEIYYGSIEYLTHTVYVSGQPTQADSPVTVRIFDGDTQVFTDTAVWEPTDLHYYTTVGQDITLLNVPLEIEWSYTVLGHAVVTPREPVSIVRPYSNFSEYKEAYPNDETTFDEFFQAEKLVRGVIDSHCRQTFQFDRNVEYTLQGSGHDVLELPRRLVNLIDVRVLDSTTDYYLVTEYVTFDKDEKYRIRRTQWDAFGAGMNPITRSNFFKAHSIYRVTGDWGWEFVPQSVKQAATILIHDYQCADAKYREKFIQNIRAADWRMEFAVTGNETTGNANADTLLSEYRHFLWEVI